MFNSTCIISLGLLVKFLLRKKGAAHQSAALKTTLITLIASVVISPFVRDMTPVQFRFTETGTDSPAMHRHFEPIIDIPRTTNNAVDRQTSRGQRDDSQSESIPARDSASLYTVRMPSTRGSVISAEESPPTLHFPPADIQTATGKSTRRLPSTVRARSLPLPLYNTLFMFIPLLWLTCSMILFIRTIIGLWNVRRLKASSAPVSEEISEICRNISDMLSIPAPNIMVSSHVGRAFVFGVMRPFIMLPSNKINDVHAAFDVLIHELAHLKERDNVWNHMFLLSKIMMPFQPLLWVLSYRYIEVSEYICDDYVMQYSGNRIDYAERLVSFASDMPNDHRLLAEGAGIISLKSQLRRRIERIVDFSYIPDVTIRDIHPAPIVFMTLAGFLITGFMSFGSSVSVNIDMAPLETADIMTSMGIISLPGNHENGLKQKSPSADPMILMGETMQLSHGDQRNEIERPVMYSTMQWNPDAIRETIQSASVQAKSLFTGYKTVSHGSAYSTAILNEKELTNIYNSRNVMPHAVHPEKVAYDYHMDIADPGLPADRLYDPIETGKYIGSMVSNLRSAEATVRNLAKLEIVIPDDFEYGDMSDPDKKKMSDIYRSLRKNMKYPTWSPDGEKIAFNDSDYGVWIVNADGGEPQLVYDNYYKLMYETYSLHFGELKTLGFSPDGEEIALRRYNINIEMGTDVVLDYSGQAVVYSINNPVPVIESVTIATGESRILAEGAITGSWSKSSRYFAYITEDQETGRELWLFDMLKDSRCEIKCSNPSTVCFTPDDESVIVTENESDGRGKVTRIEIFSGKSETLFMADNTILSDVSPNGSWLLFNDTSSDTGQFLYNAESGEITSILLSTQRETAWGKFSPDGTKMCFNMKENSGNWNIYTHDIQSLGDFSKESAPESNNPEPDSFTINGNSPNPFNMSTMIEYTVAKSGGASLQIYNSLGQKVRELVSGNIDAGLHRTLWNGLDDSGNTVSAGMYIAKLRAGGRAATHKMMVMK